MPVDCRSFERTASRRCSARSMSHGGLPITASKPGFGQRPAVLVEIHFRKFEHPVKEPAVRGDRRAACFEQRAADDVSEAPNGPSSASSQSDAKTAGSGALRASGHIQQAHQRSAIGFPASDRLASRSSRRSFSRTTSAVSSLVSASQRRSPTARASDGSRSASANRGRLQSAGADRRRAAGRLPGDVDRRRAEQAVAAHEVVIEKCERLARPTASRATATAARAAPPWD